MTQTTIDNFISHVHAHTLLTGIMSRTNFVGAEADGDNASVLEYRLPEPMDIGELLDLLDDSMELVILYHVVPTAATVMGEQCCAYSDPAVDFIYKVNAITDDNGLCDTIYATLYDSLEQLGAEVVRELDEQLSGNRTVLFARKRNDVLLDFIR